MTSRISCKAVARQSLVGRNTIPASPNSNSNTLNSNSNTLNSNSNTSKLKGRVGLRRGRRCHAERTTAQPEDHHQHRSSNSSKVSSSSSSKAVLRLARPWPAARTTATCRSMRCHRHYPRHHRWHSHSRNGTPSLSRRHRPPHRFSPSNHPHPPSLHQRSPPDQHRHRQQQQHHHHQCQQQQEQQQLLLLLLFRRGRPRSHRPILGIARRATMTFSPARRVAQRRSWSFAVRWMKRTGSVLRGSGCASRPGPRLLFCESMI